jgi:hypothetical protein
VSKKLQEKQRKRLAEQMRREQQRKAARRSNLITVGLAVLILGIVAVAVVMQSGGGTVDAPEGVPAADAGCDPIEEPEEAGNQHVDPSQQVEYETSPPTSGDHWPTELLTDPAFYPDTVEEESLVHNMEHGHVVIWYRPDAPGDTVSLLEELTEAANDDDAIPGGAVPPLITVPYDDIEDPKSYVMTAWTASQACASYSLEAINKFRERFQGRGPENAGIPPFRNE